MSKIIVEVSARHLHVTEEQIEILYGAGYKLTPKKELSQPGQYVCNEKVKVVGPKNELSMSILGPARKAAQVEVSLTDARTLGIAAPIRESGDIAGSPGCKLVGPCGEVEITEGVIAAKRHIHLDPATADAEGVKNGDVVSIKVNTPERSLTFSDVVVRVNEKFAPACHIDTDEGNAAGMSGSVEGEIIK